MESVATPSPQPPTASTTHPETTHLETTHLETKKTSEPGADAELPTLHPGLADIVLSTTRLSRVDGRRGELLLAGYRVEDIAPRVPFEDMVHLLWTGHLPDNHRRDLLHGALAARRSLTDTTVDLLRSAAATDMPPMDALAMATASLHLAANPRSAEPATDVDDGPSDLNRLGAPFDDAALRLLATMPLMVAAYERLRRGREPLPAHPDLGQAAQLLYGIDGKVPMPARVRALDTYLNTVIDHGANASTFTARVVTSTGSDLVSAVVAGLGALKGPLHGGAPGPALDMVFDIGSAERAEGFLRDKLARGERLMGFGHRVYRVRDPRAAVLEAAARNLFDDAGDRQLYQLAKHVESTAVRLLAEHRPERQLRTNVEFYTALLLHGVGLESELFTPLFALSRTAGWIAHADEQRREGRLIRPRLHYCGPRPSLPAED